MLATNTISGRVISEHKASYVVISKGAEYTATVRGHFHDEKDKQFPKVGDNVNLCIISKNKAVIENIQTRRSKLVRKSAHNNTVQVMVTNVDYIFIVMGLDADFNLRRLERYLVLAEQSHITPVVMLNKIDIADCIDLHLKQTIEIAKKTKVHAISAKTGKNMDVFMQYMKNEKTGVLLGSSGSGKSTIINYLLQKTLQDTKIVRESDSKGRHTTTSRELFPLPSGGYLIDTPGMRELGFVSKDDISKGTFSDVETLASKCKFTNCDHVKSQGCAVQNSLNFGILDKKHFANYLKLKKKDAESRLSNRKN